MIDKKYTQYAEDVLSDKIVACKYIKMACKRYLNWLERDDLDVRFEEADRVIDFCSKLKHSTGRFNNQPFILSEWQKWIVYSIFSFYYKGTEERVVKNVYIEVARKNGKTFFAAALCLYALLASGEHDAEVELIANSKKQAKICFDMCSKIVEKIDPKKKFLKRTRDTIKVPSTNSFLQVLSSDAGNNDGWNSYMFVADEVHAYENSLMFDVMKSSQGMRDNPLAFSITTAGFDLFSFCYKMRTTNIEVLSNTKVDDTQFTAIFTLDEDDDWEDEGTWIKANPNLDVTVKRQYLVEQIQQAKNNPTLEVSTKTKNFNVWMNSQDTWISNDILLKCTQKVNLDDFKDSVCYVGVDLAAVSDLTAVSLMIPSDSKIFFKTFYYLPNSALENNSNSEMYKQWYREGLLKVTPGNVTDYDIITADICKLGEKLFINTISYDSWNATSWATKMTELNQPLKPFSQTLGNFNRPTKEIERLIKSEKIIIDDNEITRFCFSNVALKYDWNENVKPVKQERQQKIDGVIAMIQALGSYLIETHYDNQII